MYQYTHPEELPDLNCAFRRYFEPDDLVAAIEALSQEAKAAIIAYFIDILCWIASAADAEAKSMHLDIAMNELNRPYHLGKRYADLGADNNVTKQYIGKLTIEFRDRFNTNQSLLRKAA